MAYLFGWPTKQMTTQIILTPLPKMFTTHTHTDRDRERHTLKWQLDSTRGEAWLGGGSGGVADMATYCAMFYATKTRKHLHAHTHTHTRSWKLLRTLLLILYHCLFACLFHPASPAPPNRSSCLPVRLSFCGSCARAPPLPMAVPPVCSSPRGRLAVSGRVVRASRAFSCKLPVKISDMSANGDSDAKFTMGEAS